MKFVLVFSFCRKDVEAAKRSASLIAKFGPYPDSHLFIQPARDVAGEDVEAIEGFLEQHFVTSKTEPPFDDAPNTWPAGPNHMFRRAAKSIQNSDYDYFYFWEPDCLPLKAGWLKAMKAEYEAVSLKGKVFMGAFHATTIQNKDGTRYQSGEHMAGTGFYPRQTPRIAPHAVLPSNFAWDVAAQDEIIPKAHQTKLIEHTWATHKYNTMDFGNAVVHHGCKDDSLFQLLMQARQPDLEAVPFEGTNEASRIANNLEEVVPVDDEDDAAESPYDVIMPHVLAMVQSLCKNSVARRKIQKQLRRACLIN